MSCMNMDNDSTVAAATMNTNTIDDITNNMSIVAVSDNSICGTCTDTSSKQKLEGISNQIRLVMPPVEVVLV